MKLLISGVWVTAVALGSAYGMAHFMPPGGDAAKAAPAAVLQSQKTRVINVPVITGGALRGFVSVQFVFTLDANLQKNLQVPPEIYLLDEAFRALYTDATLDPAHVEKYDLQKLIARLVKGTNDRLGVPLVKDVLIENFVYIDKDVDKT